MKKFIVTLSLMAILLPATTWQVYKFGVLTVYNGSDTTTGVHYQGPADGYKGTASQPPTSKWTALWLPTAPSTTTPATIQ